MQAFFRKIEKIGPFGTIGHVSLILFVYDAYTLLAYTILCYMHLLYAYIMPLQSITPPRVAEGWDFSPPFRGKLEDAELLYERLSSILLSVYGENSPELLSAAAWQELEVLPKKVDI